MEVENSLETHHIVVVARDEVDDQNRTFPLVRSMMVP